MDRGRPNNADPNLDPHWSERLDPQTQIRIKVKIQEP